MSITSESENYQDRSENQNPREVIEVWRAKAALLRERVLALPPVFSIQLDEILKIWESTFENDEALKKVLELLGFAVQELQREGGVSSDFDQAVISYLLEVRRGVQLGILENRLEIERDFADIEKAVTFAEQRSGGQTQ